MKKLYLIMIASIFSFGLIACGESAKPTDGTEEVSDLTAEEVYKKVVEKTSEMKSASTSIELSQDINLPDQGFNIIADTKMKGDIIIDSSEMHQVMDISMGGEGLEGLEQDITMEFYVTSEALYVKSEESGDEWLKLSTSELDMLDDLVGQQDDPAEQLEILNEYTEDFTFDQTDDTYILKLTADTDQFVELIKETIGDSMPQDVVGEMDNGFDLMENLEIRDLTYEIIVDKETFYLTNFTLDMDITISHEGSSADMTQTIKAAYENIDEIDSIEIPQEVIDNAVEG